MTKSLAILVDLPDSINLSQQQARELLVLKLIDEGRLSQSQAAKVLGVTRHDVLDLMARNRVPVVRYSSGDFEREAAVLRSAAQSRRRRKGR